MTVGSRVALVVVLALVPVVARADQRAQADAAFKRGREAFKIGKFAEACEAFDESQALDPQLGTKFNLAQCLEKVGKLATALGMYKELIAVDDNAVRKSLTTDAMNSLLPRVPKISITIDKPPAGLLVTVQDSTGHGKPMNPAEPALVDVGTYRVIASGQGVKDWTSPPTSASEGQTTQLVVVFSQADAKSAEGTHHSIWDPQARPRLKAAGIMTAGGAVLVTSLVFGYLAFKYHGEAEDICSGGTMCATQAQLVQAQDLDGKSQNRGTISTVLFVVGAAAVGTGGVMYLLASHSEPTIGAQVTASSGAVTFTKRF